MRKANLKSFLKYLCRVQEISVISQAASFIKGDFPKACALEPFFLTDHTHT